jgi:hypothetical protein
VWLGSALLYVWVNPLTMWLTFATFVGYAVIYTVILKPLTPQNIVIGGASGAMPPVLGWAAMTNDVGPEALILFLIIFLWTPPHFWALALYRVEDYRKSGLPMLPVTHGNEFTRLQILLYTLVLFAACLMPFVYGMSSWLYLVAAVVLSVGFCWYAFCAVAQLLRRPGAQDLPLFPDPPERAVCRAAGGPLYFVRHHASKRNALKLIAAGAWWLRCHAIGCLFRKKPQFRASTSPAPTTPATSADRPQRPAAQHQGLRRQGGGGVLRLHPVPRCLPHLHAELAEVKQAAGQGRRQAAGHLRHGGPGARHARGAQGLHGQLRPQLPGAAPGTPEQLAAVAKDFKVYYKKVEGKTPTSYTMDHSAGSYVYDTQAGLRLLSDRYGSGAQALARAWRSRRPAGWCRP